MVNETISSKQTRTGEPIALDWDIKELNDVSNIIDSLHQTPSFLDHGYAMVRVTDIKAGNLNLEKVARVDDKTYLEFIRNYKPVRGDIVLSRVGSYGVTSFVDTDEPFCMGQNTLVIHPMIDNRFLYYILNSDFVRQQMEKGSFGTGYKSLSLKNVKELRLPIPVQEEEQYKIAKILSDIDQIIELIDKLIEKKKNIKQGAMQKLLTGTKRLPGFFEEWETRTLGSLGSFFKGKGLPKKDIASSGKIRAIPYTLIYTDFNEVIKYEKITTYTSSDDAVVIDSPHLLIAGSSNMLENVGKATAFCNYARVAVGGDVIILKTSEDVRFISYLLNTPAHRKRIVYLSQGSTIRHVYVSTFANYEINIPKIQEQSAIADVLTDIELEIEALEHKRDKYKQLKVGLMQQLLTGRIRLKCKN